MKKIAAVLDDVHTLAQEVERSTRRKKHLRREHIIAAFHFARIIANGVAAITPKALPVAVVLNGLNEVIPKKKESDHAADGKCDQDAG